MSTALSITETAALLRATIPLLQAEIAALSDPLLCFRPALGEWSIKEVLGHLIEAEQRGFAGRIRHILAEDNHQCLAWDPDQVAAERHDQAKAAQTLLQEFVALRTKSVTLVEQLTAEQLARTGQHPTVGVLSINDLLHEWVHHDWNHFKQILSNGQAWVWPQMGNAQRFTKV